MDSESRIARLEHLSKLLDKGVITDEEFSIEKKKVLGSEVPKHSMISDPSPSERSIYLEPAPEPEPFRERDPTPTQNSDPQSAVGAEQKAIDHPEAMQVEDWLKIGSALVAALLIIGALTGHLIAIFLVIGICLCSLGYLLRKGFYPNIAENFSVDAKAASLTLAGFAVIAIALIFGQLSLPVSAVDGISEGQLEGFEDTTVSAPASTSSSEYSRKSSQTCDMSQIYLEASDYCVAIVMLHVRNIPILDKTTDAIKHRLSRCDRDAPYHGGAYSTVEYAGLTASTRVERALGDRIYEDYGNSGSMCFSQVKGPADYHCATSYDCAGVNGAPEPGSQVYWRP